MEKSELSKMASIMGKKGGETTKKRKGKNFYSTIGKYAMQVRWAGHVKKNSV